MAIQTMAIPMPSEVILPFAGFLATTGRFNFMALILSAATGSCIGASAAYFIGRHGGRPLVEKYGRIIFISRRDLEMTEKFFQKFGSWAAFFGQLLPVVRSFISFPAGIAKLKYWKFVLFTFVGSFFWSAALIFLGMKLGENWASLRNTFKKFDLAIVILLAVIIFWLVWRHVKNTKK